MADENTTSTAIIDWENIWNTITDFFQDNVWRILGFFATLLFGIIVIKIVMYALRKGFAKTRIEKITQKFILTIIRFCLWLVLVLTLLNIVGIALTGVITALSAIVLAIGMALEDNIANLANGIVIISTQMFKKGDWIAVDGAEGSIDDINFLFTTLITADNKRVTLPNSKIVNNAVVNSGANKTRRVDFTFSVAYETDVETVKKIVIDVMHANGKIYDNDEHKPFCRLKNLGASSIDFFANCWCDKEDYWDIYYYVIETVYNEFKKHGISVPYQQLEVRRREDDVQLPFDVSNLPERVEKVREEEPQNNIERLIDDVEERRRKRKMRSKKKSDKNN